VCDSLQQAVFATNRPPKWLQRIYTADVEGQLQARDDCVTMEMENLEMELEKAENRGRKSVGAKIGLGAIAKYGQTAEMVFYTNNFIFMVFCNAIVTFS